MGDRRQTCATQKQETTCLRLELNDGTWICEYVVWGEETTIDSEDNGVIWR